MRGFGYRRSLNRNLGEKYQLTGAGDEAKLADLYIQRGENLLPLFGDVNSMIQLPVTRLIVDDNRKLQVVELSFLTAYKLSLYQKFRRPQDLVHVKVAMGLLQMSGIDPNEGIERYISKPAQPKLRHIIKNIGDYG